MKKLILTAILMMTTTAWANPFEKENLLIGRAADRCQFLQSLQDNVADLFEPHQRFIQPVSQLRCVESLNQLDADWVESNLNDQDLDWYEDALIIFEQGQNPDFHIDRPIMKFEYEEQDRPDFN